MNTIPYFEAKSFQRTLHSPFDSYKCSDNIEQIRQTAISATLRLISPIFTTGILKCKRQGEGGTLTFARISYHHLTIGQ
jgi:hypothetical protein